MIAGGTFRAIGLLFVDGHEDTTPLDVSEDGEAASSELGILLGMTGRTPGFPLASETPVLTPDRVAVVGPRDAELRRSYNLGSLREHCAYYRDGMATAAQAGSTGREAAQRLRGVGPWWLHIDLDVLDPTVFPAAAVPGDDGDPGGLTWAQLTELTTGAISVGGCVGLSVALYDPTLDPERAHAPRIVALTHASLAGVLSGGEL